MGAFIVRIVCIVFAKREVVKEKVEQHEDTDHVSDVEVAGKSQWKKDDEKLIFAEFD